MPDLYNLKTYSSTGKACGDGKSHLLRERFATLADARRTYPFAQSLDEEIDRCALQRVVQLARVQHGGDPPAGKQILMPSGVYLLDRTVTIDSVKGLELLGYGPATKFVWRGPPDQPAFLLSDTDSCQFRKFYLAQETGHSFTYGFQLKNGGAGIVTPTANVFADVDVAGGVHCWGIDRGLDEDGLGGGDQNNELHQWIRCKATLYTSSAWRVDAGQAHSLVFRDCQMQGNGRGVSGVWCSYGSSFHWSGGSGGGNLDDFLLDDFGLVVSVRGWNSEGSERLARVHSKGYTGVAFNVAFESCRWAGMPSASDDGVILRVMNAGPLSVRNNLLVSDNGVNPMVSHGALGGVGPVSTEHVGNTYKGGTRYKASALLLQSEHDTLDRCNKYLDPAIPGDHDDRWDCWSVEKKE